VKLVQFEYPPGGTKYALFISGVRLTEPVPGYDNYLTIHIDTVGRDGSLGFGFSSSQGQIEDGRALYADIVRQMEGE